MTNPKTTPSTSGSASGLSEPEGGASSGCGTSGQPSRFEALGGEPILRMMIDRFVERVFADPMIGFFFAKASRERIKAKEYEHAATLLGGPGGYSGRPLAQAHARHPIMGGHFLRRLAILRQVLVDFAAPPEIAEYWLAHDNELRPLITHDSERECTDPLQARKSSAAPSDPAPTAGALPKSRS